MLRNAVDDRCVWLLHDYLSEKRREIDQKYDYKREKVERNTAKEHREGHQGLEQGHDSYNNDW